jgi:hypothetical protein
MKYGYTRISTDDHPRPCIAKNGPSKRVSGGNGPRVSCACPSPAAPTFQGRSQRDGRDAQLALFSMPDPKSATGNSDGKPRRRRTYFTARFSTSSWPASVSAAQK